MNSGFPALAAIKLFLGLAIGPIGAGTPKGESPDFCVLYFPGLKVGAIQLVRFHKLI